MLYKTILLTSAFFASCNSSPEEINSRHSSERSASESSKEDAENLGLAKIGVGSGIAKCMTADQFKGFCKSVLTTITPAACKELLPKAGCFIKDLGLGAAFCHYTCKDEGPIGAVLCKNACNAFVNESPGPYSYLGSPFLDGNCADIPKSIKDFCNTTLKDMRAIEAKSAE